MARPLIAWIARAAKAAHPIVCGSMLLRGCLRRPQRNRRRSANPRLGSVLDETCRRHRPWSGDAARRAASSQTWQRLLAGESGIKRIEKFDVSDLACKIAGQVPRGDGSDGTFNADQWMEPKEQRKVDDFIIFAMCGGDASAQRRRLASARL